MSPAMAALFRTRRDMTSLTGLTFLYFFERSDDVFPIIASCFMNTLL